MNLSIKCYIETANKIGKTVLLNKIFTTMIVAEHPTNSHRVNYIQIHFILFICYTTSTCCDCIFKSILTIVKQVFLKKEKRIEKISSAEKYYIYLFEILN